MTANWEKIYAPSPWEDEGFNGYDGFAWYRKKFDGKELSKDESYYLNLGFIDDCDEVYLNGVLIGFSGSMPPKFKTAFNNERKYPLSNESINFYGMNTLAIRVFDVTLGWWNYRWRHRDLSFAKEPNVGGLARDVAIPSGLGR